MSYTATKVGGAHDGTKIEYANQFFLVRHLLLGTIRIDTVQAIKAFDEIEELCRSMERQPSRMEVVAPANDVVEAWRRLGRCEDEFGSPSEYCGEYADRLDDEIVALQSALRNTFPCPRCEGQKHDQGACGVCENRGYVLPSELQQQAKEKHAAG